MPTTYSGPLQSTLLSDLPVEVHPQTIGLWVDFKPDKGSDYTITTFIIRAVNNSDDPDNPEYEVFNAEIGHELVTPDQLTLRFDLPRVCNPDGSPRI